MNNVYRQTREWVEKSAQAGKKWIAATDADYAGKRSNVADSQDDIRRECLGGNLMASSAGIEYYFGGNMGETDLAVKDFRSRAKMYRFSRYAQELRPGAILCDIGMRELDGYETYRLLRQQPWQQPVVMIALTGYGQPEDKRRAMEAGFDAHLVKPIDLQALLELEA